MKKLLLILILTFSVFSFQDLFTDDNGTALETHDANWASIGGSFIVTNFEIVDNTVQVEAAWQYAGAMYSTSGSDSAEVDIIHGVGYTGRGLSVRANTNTRGYGINLGNIVGSEYTSLDITLNGAYVASASVAGAWDTSVTHTIKMHVDENATHDTATILTWVDDVQLTTRHHPNEDNADPMIAAGYPAIWVNEVPTVEQSRFDNFDDLSEEIVSDSFDLDTGLVFDGASDGSPTATALRLEDGEIDTVASNPAEGSQCDSIAYIGDVSGRSSTADDSVFLTMTENYVCSLFYSEIPPVIDSCERLNQLMVRKDRKAVGTWGPDSFEFSDHYFWRPEGVCYYDTITGHEVWKITTTSELLNIWHDDISVSPWSADGKRMAFLSERTTGAYTESEGRRWFIINTDGSFTRTALNTPITDDGTNSYFHWSEQETDAAYGFWYDADSHTSYDECDLIKCTISDTGENASLILTFPTTHGSLLKVYKTLSSDGRKVFAMPLDESWNYPATIYPNGSAALVDADGYTVDRGLSTDWSGTGASYAAFHDQYLRGNGSWIYIMQSNYSAIWLIKVLGSAADGGPQYYFAAPDTFREEVPVSPLYGNVWGCEYWVHPGIDPWGRKVVFGNGEYGLHGGAGYWDTQLRRYDTLTYQLGYQHGDWRYSDFTSYSYGYASSDSQDYSCDHIMVSSWNKSRPIDTVCWTHTLYNNQGWYAGATYEYNGTTRPGSSPDGTKTAFHSVFLQPKSGSYDDNPDVYWAVCYYPYPPTDLEAAESAGDSIDIKFLPPKYTERGWPYADPDPDTGSTGWPLLTGADSLEIGEPCYAREARRYRIWRSSDGSTGWQPIGLVEARYESTYPGSVDSLMLHPVKNGIKVSASNKLTFRCLPGDGTYYYALTTQEHSGIESDSLSEVLSVTISSGTISAQEISGTSGQTGFWTTSPTEVTEASYVDETPTGMFTIYWEHPSDANNLIRYFNIYYDENAIPSTDQRNRVASVSVNNLSQWRDFLAYDGTPHYTITSVDYFGNESDSMIISSGDRKKQYLLVVSDTVSYGYTGIDGAIWCDSGAGIVVNAVSDSGYHFVAWETVSGTLEWDDSTAAVAACTLSTDDAIIRALFGSTYPSGSYVLTMTNDGHGTTSPVSDTTVDSGTIANIAAAPSDNYHFGYWSATIGSVVFNEDSTTCQLNTGNATIRANFYIDTFHCAATGDAHAIITFLGDSLAAYGETIVCTLTVSAEYVTDGSWGHVGDGKHVLSIVTTSDTSVTATSHALPTYTIDTVYETHAPITTPHASLVFDSVSPAPLCTLFCVPDNLYAAKWQGGTVYYPNIDTFIISVTADSTVTALNYLIPIINSIVARVRRDVSGWNVARPGDTVTAISTGLFDQGDSSAVFINSTGTVRGEILNWYADSVRYRIPIGTPRGYYRTRTRNRYEIISVMPTSNNFYVKTAGR